MIFLRLLLLILTIFSSPITSKAQLNWHVYNYFKNTGGLNDGFDPTAIRPDEASDLQNVVFTTAGAIAKRSGFENINTSALSGTPTFTGVTYFRLANQTKFLVAITTDDKIWSMAYGTGTSGPTGTWVDRTGSLSFNVGQDDQADFQAAQDQLVIEDGLNSTPPYVWTGSGNATALGGSPPNAMFVEYYQNHLFLAGNSANPSTLYFSNINNIAAWTATDTILVSTNDGSIIRGLKTALDGLYIFKDFSIFRLTGTNRDNFRLELMVRDVGTLANQAIQLINNIFYFPSANFDIFRYDGGYNAQIISKRIQGTIDGLAPNRFSETVAATYQNRYYLVSASASGSGTHNRIIYYDTFLDAFSKFLGINANAISNYIRGNDSEAVLFGDYSGFANTYPSTNSDAGAAINGYYQTGWLGIFDLPGDKYWKLLRVFVNSQGNYNLTVQVRSDFESPGTSNSISLATGGALYDTAIYDSASYADQNTIVGRIEVNKGVNFFQILFSNNAAAQPFSIKGWQNFIEPTERI